MGTSAAVLEGEFQTIFRALHEAESAYDQACETAQLSDMVSAVHELLHRLDLLTLHLTEQQETRLLMKTTMAVLVHQNSKANMPASTKLKLSH